MKNESIMKNILLLLLVALPFLSISCVGETSYYSDSGTLKIPFGTKEGQRNPEEAFGS